MTGLNILLLKNNRSFLPSSSMALQLKSSPGLLDLLFQSSMRIQKGFSIFSYIVLSSLSLLTHNSYSYLSSVHYFLYFTLGIITDMGENTEGKVVSPIQEYFMNPYFLFTFSSLYLFLFLLH